MTVTASNSPPALRTSSIDRVMRIPAKINLYLKVTAKRPDGYHEIRSLFLPLVEIADDLTLGDGDDGLQLTVSGLPVSNAEDNLVCRAARRYAECAGIAPHWRFSLTKRIPVAAGMGGGSADAAAALRLLQERYGALDQEALHHLAAGLGADVPFFLNPRPGFATGIGEQFVPLDGPVRIPPLLIINPRFPVSARWAYTHLDPAQIGDDDSGRAEALAEALMAGDAVAVARAIHNDLAAALYRKFPLLVLLREFLIRHGALHAEITGSGPTLYAVCPSSAVRDRLREELEAAWPAALLLLSA